MVRAHHLSWPSWITTRRAALVLVDGGIAAAALWIAMFLRFEGSIPGSYNVLLPRFTVLLAAARVIASLILQIERWSFRLSGLVDAARVFIAGILGTGLFLTLVFLLRPDALPQARLVPPRSVVVLEFFLSTAAMGLLRFSPRLAILYRGDIQRARRKGSLRTLIVGAGATGELLLRNLRGSDEHDYSVVGFLDDDQGKWRTIVSGRPVLGAIEELPEWVERLDIHKVLLAIPNLPAVRIREILTLCGDLKVHFKILPVSYLYVQERAAEALVQDLTPEDLLSREPVNFVHKTGKIEGRAVLVTGGAGSIGSEACLQLLKAGVGRLVIVDSNENALYMLTRRFEREFPEAQIIAEIADVRHLDRIEGLVRRYRPLDLIHAAAHKQVPLMETAPSEAVKTNVGGTKVVVDVAEATGVERFVFISSDKAVRPSSVMGASKRVGEMLVKQAASSASTTKFCAVRFGNVLGSAGSVVPLFREQIRSGGPVTVTHPDVRRYFMTTSEAVGLVLKTAYGDYGELCVLEMGEQLRILDLAKHMITMSGLVPDVDIKIEFTGLRAGEKLSEELMIEDEERTHRVTDRICVIETPPSNRNIENQVISLLEAAGKQNDDRVIQILRRIVPSYASDLQVASAPASM